MFLLVAILLLGIGLRSPEVLNRNFIFGFDQGRDYLAVREIVIQRNPTLIGPEVGAGFAGLGGIFHGPYYYYSLVPLFILFNGHPYGGLVTMFLFGIASLFLAFYIFQRIYGTQAALVATFLLAICPSISSQSRFLWNSHPTTFFILLALWFTYKISQEPIKYFFLATFFAGLIYGFELAISVPLILGQFLFVWLVLKAKDDKVYLAGLLGALIAHLPFLLFELKHGLMATKGILAASMKFFQPGEAIDYLVLIRGHFFSLWFNYDMTFLLGRWPPILLLAFFIFGTFRILKKEKSKKKKNFMIFLTILPLATFGVFFFLNNAIWNHYLIHLHLAYIFLFAYYFQAVKSLPAKTFFALLLILMLPGVSHEIGRVHSDFYDDGGTAKIKNQIKALDYIYQDAQGEKFNLLVFTPPVYDYSYQYLLHWYGEEKYDYFPGSEKKGLFYLWIEPEPSMIWHEGWLETVVKTGRIIKEETLPSGFIIQKRYGED